MINRPNRDCAAVCGLFCGSCPSFIEGECGGCLSENCVCDCFNGFKDCANSHAVERCFECDEFPCENLEDFSKKHIVNGICHHKDVIDDLRKMKDTGLDNWVADQTTKHTCPNCGTLIAWYDKECECKKKI